MSNVETYLAYLSGEYTGELPTPRAIRRELYLAKMCGMDVGTLPEPISQSDIYLKNLAENGTGGGGDLPALANAALAGDILDGKEAIDGSGKKFTGTMPDNGTVTQKLTASAPEYTIPAGKHSGGGKVSVDVEEKSATPSTSAQEVAPSDGKVLSKVTVEAVQTEEKSVTPTTTAQEVTPSDGKFLSKVTVGAATGGMQITDASYLFYKDSRKDDVNAILPQIKNAKTMKYMFSGSLSAASDANFDLLDTSKTEDFSGFFEGCSNVGIDLAAKIKNTSSATSMHSMFRLCSSMCSGLNLSNRGVPDLSAFNTAKVTDMGYMFSDCTAVTSLDLSNFDTSKVTSMLYMFNSCSKLANINLTGWDTSNVTNMAGMFRNCNSLTSLNLSGFDTSKVTNMSALFEASKALTQIIGFSASARAGISIGFPQGNSMNRSALKRLTFRTDLPEGKYAIRSAINISYCDMERSGFNEMISTITDVSGLNLSANYTKITITGNPCITGTNKAGETVETLTDADRAAATAKGWTLVE